jgi:O-antigen/teichoic acid export membrane protein
VSGRGFWASGEVAVGALLLAAAWAAVLLALDRPATARLRHGGAPAGPPRQWLGLARKVLPLGIAGALIVLNASLPRYLIAAQLGAAALGRFAAMASFVAAGTMLATVLGQTASPRLARAAALRDRATFARLMATILLPCVALGLLLLLLSSSHHDHDL